MMINSDYFIYDKPQVDHFTLKYSGMMMQGFTNAILQIIMVKSLKQSYQIIV